MFRRVRRFCGSGTRCASRDCIVVADTGVRLWCRYGASGAVAESVEEAAHGSTDVLAPLKRVSRFGYRRHGLIAVSVVCVGRKPLDRRHDLSQLIGRFYAIWPPSFGARRAPFVRSASIGCQTLTAQRALDDVKAALRGSHCYSCRWVCDLQPSDLADTH